MPIQTINGVQVDIGPGVQLQSRNLRGADLRGANLRGAYISDCLMQGANLEGADLEGATLSYTDASEVNLQNANLRRTNCESSWFVASKFQRAQLVNTSFRNANLSRADFSGTTFDTVNLAYAIRTGWDITNTTFTNTPQPCSDCNRFDCVCRFCRECNVRATRSLCNICRSCRNCCECVRCSNCSNSIPRDTSVCEECEYCASCCRCNDFQETNPSRIHGALKGECARLAGVEYETTKEPTRDGKAWAKTWGAGWHYDGSCGYEAVTPPCAGSKIAECLTALGDVIGPTDDRCGIHVHVDAKDYMWHDMYRFLRLYAKLEPLLFVLAGQQRINNNYCAPCGETYLKALASKDPKNAVLALAYGVEITQERQYRTRERHIRDKKGNVKRIKPGRVKTVGFGKYCNRISPCKKLSGRYRSINIAPWVFGRRITSALRSDTTLEFRLHMHGYDTKNVIAWTYLCVALVEWCAKASDAEVANLPKSALKALCSIAPNSKEYILRRIKDWRNESRVGKEPRRVTSRWTINYEAKTTRGAARIPTAQIDNQGNCQCEVCVRARRPARRAV